MQRSNVSIPEEQASLLRYLAWRRQRPFAEIVQEAIAEYLARQDFPDDLFVPDPPPPSPEWRAGFSAAVERLRASVPEDMTAEEIEQLITEASEGIADDPHVIPPRRTLPDAEWSARMDALLREIHARIPPDVTPEELEADVDAAWEEYQAERQAQLQARHPGD